MNLANVTRVAQFGNEPDRVNQELAAGGVLLQTGCNPYGDMTYLIGYQRKCRCNTAECSHADGDICPACGCDTPYREDPATMPTYSREQLRVAVTLGADIFKATTDIEQALSAAIRSLGCVVTP